jgi:hypothetical protein
MSQSDQVACMLPAFWFDDFACGTTLGRQTSDFATGLLFYTVYLRLVNCELVTLVQFVLHLSPGLFC